MHRPLSHWLLLASLVVMWGSLFLLIKLALASFSPSGLVAGRLVLAAAVLFVVLYAKGRRLPRGRKHWQSFLAMAVVGNVLPFWLISWGQQGIDSGLSGILMAIMPLTTVVLAHFFLDDEPLDRFRVAGFAIGFSGIVVLMGPEALLELRGQGTELWSELAVLSGAVCYAINTIVTRRRPKSDPVTASAGVMLVATALMLPVVAFIELPVVAPIDWSAGLAVIALGLLSTALATLLFFRLIALAGPGFMSLTNYLIPPWAVVAGFLFLGEVPSWSALTALSLILIGILVSERSRARRLSGA